RGRRLPLGLGGQPPSSPATIRLRLVPVDVQHRPMRLQRHPVIEVAPPPAVRLVLPVDRLRGPGFLTPAPALLPPQLAAPIAILLDEGGELGLGDRRAGDGKGR